MSIPSGPMFDPPPGFYSDPSDLAMQYIDYRRLRAEILNRCIPSYFAPHEKPLSIFACLRYLTRRGLKNWDCTCKAWKREGSKHGQNCQVSPEYAALCEEMNIAPELALGAICFTMWYLNWDDWDVTKHQIKNMDWSKNG